MESTEWPGTGILSGMTQKLGNWYECLLVSENNVTGKYCSVSAKYDIGRRGITSGAPSSNNSHDSVWKSMQKVLLWRGKEARISNWGAEGMHVSNWVAKKLALLHKLER